jgi:hypothetical protein
MIYQIWSLPKLSLVFSTPFLSKAPNICIDDFSSPAICIDEHSDTPEEEKLEDLVVNTIGDAIDRHYLTVAIYTLKIVS